MVCRVKVMIRTEEGVVETSALLNSGFESDEPDIVIPVSVAEKLHLWPPRSTMSTLLETDGGAEKLLLFSVSLLTIMASVMLMPEKLYTTGEVARIFVFPMWL
jgi:hypothetical protein